MATSLYSFITSSALHSWPFYDQPTPSVFLSTCSSCLPGLSVICPSIQHSLSAVSASAVLATVSLFIAAVSASAAILFSYCSPCCCVCISAAFWFYLQDFRNKSLHPLIAAVSVYQLHSGFICRTSAPSLCTCFLLLCLCISCIPVLFVGLP
ncbi:hypothetical protein K435DRAFT_408583 [Dendrothele bispora CBS 962.96]|uniref:Uncharacterized protein n=1 Tax=Dendrothele bispora (strain CBS 962.96) TaxID=1314807 RepID=A0A4S8L6J5_DENBC|nr:hypothetical protein K435DRAFT_408583 [Dendrothele bispora CBS 962.96]